MEFLSRNVLPIAVDIRTSKNITYTPAPDIIHEAAGHAPIIANKDYADYLSAYGEISQKAIESKYDAEQYEIVRELSVLKDNPNAYVFIVGDETTGVDRILIPLNFQLYTFCPSL